MNPREIAPCFPELESLETVSPDAFRAKVRVGISVVRGTMDFEFKIADKVPLFSAKLIGSGRGVGSTVEVQTKFNIDEIGSGTKLTWIADVTFGGVMAGLGAKLLNSTSEKMVTQVLENLKNKLIERSGKA
jgi:carbon monoxide dehydrogenase subunit G